MKVTTRIKVLLSFLFVLLAFVLVLLLLICYKSANKVGRLQSAMAQAESLRIIHFDLSTDQLKKHQSKITDPVVIKRVAKLVDFRRPNGSPLWIPVYHLIFEKNGDSTSELAVISVKPGGYWSAPGLGFKKDRGPSPKLWNYLESGEWNCDSAGDRGKGPCD